MAITKADKKVVLDELIAAFKGAKSVVFTQYQGTNVENIKMLRRKLREQKVDFKVARKTLITLAAKELGMAEIPDEFMKGPIALAFANGDNVAPAKIIFDFSKTTETIKISGAYFEGKMMPASEAQVIAMLPSREVLISKMLGSLKSPISGFHSVLHGILRSFVGVVDAYSKKK